MQRISLGPLATYTGSAGVSRMRSLLVQARSLSLKLESFGTPSVFASLPKLRVVVGDVNSSVQQQQQRNRPTPMPVHIRPFRVSKRKRKASFFFRTFRALGTSNRIPRSSVFTRLPCKARARGGKIRFRKKHLPSGRFLLLQVTTRSARLLLIFTTFPSHSSYVGTSMKCQMFQ